MEITQSLLKANLIYDPLSGIFTWGVNKRRVKAGQEAGNIDSTHHVKYRKIGIMGNNYFAHRLAWLYVYGEFPKDCIDHIDGDGLNNRLSNLRSVTPKENQKNIKRNKHNKSGVSGVYFDKKSNKWRAKIKVNRKTIHLGSFEKFIDSVEARMAAEIRYDFHPNHGNDRIRESQ